MTRMSRNRKKGAIGLPVLLISGALLIMGMFFTVEMPLKMIQQSEMVDTLSNAANGAVTMIDKPSLQKGHIVIDEPKARMAAFNLIAESYGLVMADPTNPEAPSNKGNQPFTADSIEKSGKIKDIRVYFQVVDVAEQVERDNNAKTDLLTRAGTTLVWNYMEKDPVTGQMKAVNFVDEQVKEEVGLIYFDSVAVRMDIEFEKHVLNDDGMKAARTAVAQARIQNYKKN